MTSQSFYLLLLFIIPILSQRTTNVRCRLVIITSYPGVAMDIYKICLDEISLEGLDGVTIPTLWLRLTNRNGGIPVKNFNNADVFKDYLWSFFSQQRHLEFFTLPEDRYEPVLFQR